MSHNLKVRGLNFTLRPSESLENPSAIAQLLTASQVDASVISQIIQAFEVSYFQLGDDILVPSPEDLNNVVSDFYLICQGQVRLLCQGEHHPRSVTAMLLDVNSGFGADHLLSPTPFPYRAIAVGSVQIARLAANQLAPLLEKYPLLRSHLQQAALQRERVIFFKTATSLESCSSHQLKQFTSLLTEQQIAAGESLTHATPADTGHFWLRQGKIFKAADEAADDVHSLSSGDLIPTHWGYPEATPPHWVAQTDLRVYVLPFNQWQAANAIIPTLNLSALDGDAESQPVSKPSTSKPSTKPSVARSPQLHHYLHKQKIPSQLEATPSEREAIAFPKPLKRHLSDFLQRYPWIEQQSSSDCGAACLAMLCAYWDNPLPIHVLRERANVGRSGTSLKGLANAAENVGFHARPVRANLVRMAEQTEPWIAHWEGMHYVVVYQIKGDQVILADPALGRRRVTRAVFQEHWTGYALLLEPTAKLSESETQKSSFGRYFGTLFSYRSLIAQIIFFSVLIQVFGLITPLLTQVILDRVVVEKSLNTLNVFALGLLLFTFGNIGLSLVRQYLLSFLSNRLDLTLISGFISHTLSLPLKFFEARRVGDILTRVQENQKIQRFLIQQVVLAWLNFLTGFIYLGLMLYYNWRLTMLVLLLIPPILLLTLAATPMLRQISREIFKETTDQSSVLVEMMTGINTIKAVASEREIRWRWEDHLTRQMNTQFRGQKLGIKLQAMNGLINGIGSTALLWYGATLVIQDQLTIGQFVAFNMMMGYVISPIIALANLWDELQDVLISIERLDDVFETAPEATPGQSLLMLPCLRGNVRFENVTFRYSEDEERNTLQNISFEAEAGQMIAIVGRSGSGKTTLVNLLEGLYQPNHGRVLIDGHDIRHVSQQSLRSQFGVVPQECFLFSGTILENITLYRSEYSLEQAVEAAKLAEAHGFIQNMPLGYSTKVGERGVCLSGGQRQRIAIARALLTHPRVLILDEATSALDTESESRFQHNLMQISGKSSRETRTVFVIAHRLSTIRNADNILVIDRGNLVEQGTHTELIASHGLYYHLAQQQLDL
ncbi:MAG: peptidase domain-containing ABC transporter [Timaviella obliquedivisa GSE-PSE-MK23-08B]|jgi:ATP-binding cassette subfamily B protein|nr:peptidase domain-containing ABC transporter [Timaviella obliquedivisa GSE-PSE-MK23-08B]